MPANGSEVAAIKEQITAEFLAAQLGLRGLKAGTSRHQTMIARQERVAVLHGELQKLVGSNAIAVVAETCDSLPDTPTRADVLAVLRHELGNSEETEMLCDRLQDAWETIDLLIQRFGVEQARAMTLAPLYGG